MSDTYAWFGCAYFVYDMWSMYEVHFTKVADKRQLVAVQRQQQPGPETREGSDVDGMYDRAAGEDGGDRAGSKRSDDANRVSDADMALWMKRLKSVRVDERPTFVGYCAANPVMTLHHVFLQSFGLFVIVVGILTVIHSRWITFWF